MPLDIRVLRYFVQVAELGSMSLASRALNIAQPALSQRMASLENHLGVQLLLRSPRGVELTESGQRLLDHARELLERVRAIEEELGRESGVLRGSVMLGLPAPAANILLVPLFRRLRDAHPELRLRIEEARTHNLLSGLLAGHFDLAVTSHVGESGRIEAEPLATESLHVVGAASSGLGETIAFKDLSDLPLAISSQVNEQRTAMGLIARRMKSPLHIVLESTSLPTTKRLVQDGDLFAIMTRSAAVEEVEAGTLRAARIVEPELPRPLFLSQLRDRRHSAAVQTVAAAIRACIGELSAAARFR